MPRERDRRSIASRSERDPGRSHASTGSRDTDSTRNEPMVRPNQTSGKTWSNLVANYERDAKENSRHYKNRHRDFDPVALFGSDSPILVTELDEFVRNPFHQHLVGPIQIFEDDPRSCRWKLSRKIRVDAQRDHSRV